MSLGRALVLAIVQGLTEFLPVSSSGHLVIFQKILGFHEPPFFFDILVHVGTLGAILIFFKDQILVALKDRRLIFLFGMATLPACFLALFLKDSINQIFNSLRLTGAFYLIMALILLSTRFLKEPSKGKRELGWVDALVIGVFQALAIFPGVSRSGSTIAAGLGRGISREKAFDFSFLLGAVAIIGALVFQISDFGGFPSAEAGGGLLAMVVAGGVGYFSLRSLKGLVQRNQLFWFGFYCLFLGLALLGWECRS